MLPRVNFPPDSVWAPATKEESGRARSVALAKSTGSSDPSRTVPVMVPVCCALEKSGKQKMLPASTDKYIAFLSIRFKYRILIYSKPDNNLKELDRKSTRLNSSH